MTAVAHRIVRRAPGLAVYLDGRVTALLFLGFASGLPLMLLGRTLTARLAEAGVEVATIGLFGLVMAPYALKFLWAPAVDRLPVPLLTPAFGRRRGWMLLAQAGLIAAILALGHTDPATAPRLTALFALLVAFFSATQDIVIDAYRIEALKPGQYGAGAANLVAGYRVGMWAATAGALVVAERAGWNAAHVTMALLVGVGVVTALLVPEPRPAAPPAPAASGGAGDDRRLIAGIAFGLGLLVGLSAAEVADGGVAAGLVAGTLAALGVFGLASGGRAARLRDAVLEPFRDFVRRSGPATAAGILAFISLFKASDVLLTLMANPFYLQTGFTKGQIAWVSGTFGFAVTFLGAYLAGSLVYRLGILRTLWLGGALMALSNLMFALLAATGPNLAVFHLTILVENLSGGMGTTAFVAYLASLCDTRYTAVQYALLTSFMQLLGKFVVVPGSGFLAAGLGWVGFFLLSAAAGLPALLILWWLGRHGPAPGAGTTGEEATTG